MKTELIKKVIEKLATITGGSDNVTEKILTEELMRLTTKGLKTLATMLRVEVTKVEVAKTEVDGEKQQEQQ